MVKILIINQEQIIMDWYHVWKLSKYIQKKTMFIFENQWTSQKQQQTRGEQKTHGHQWKLLKIVEEAMRINKAINEITKKQQHGKQWETIKNNQHR